MIVFNLNKLLTSKSNKILYINPARLEAGMDAIIKGPPLSLISIAGMVPEHDAKLFDFKVDK